MKINNKIDIIAVKKKLLNKLGYQPINENRVELEIINYLGSAQIPYPVSVGLTPNLLYLIKRQIHLTNTISFSFIDLNPG